MSQLRLLDNNKPFPACCLCRAVLGCLCVPLMTSATAQQSAPATESALTQRDVLAVSSVRCSGKLKQMRTKLFGYFGAIATACQLFGACASNRGGELKAQTYVPIAWFTGTDEKTGRRLFEILASSEIHASSFGSATQVISVSQADAKKARELLEKAIVDEGLHAGTLKSTP